MTDPVFPPLDSSPLPRPKWWGINPDEYQVSAFLPTAPVTTLNLYESGAIPKKLPPHIPRRMVGAQPPFKIVLNDVVPRKRLFDYPHINITSILPTVSPPPGNLYDGSAPPRKRPPHAVAPDRSVPQASAIASNVFPGPPPPRRLPPPMPVRSGFVLAGPPPAITNLAQALQEFEVPTKPIRYIPEIPNVWPVALSVSLVLPPLIPIPENGPKPKYPWPEDAAFPNVIAQPPLIALAQAEDDFSPTGLPKKQWFADPPFPSVVLQPSPQLNSRVIVVPWRNRGNWPEDAAAPNIPSLPQFTAATAPGFSYDYPAPAKRFYTIDAAPQDFWALPLLAIPPALYDYPANAAKRWPGDYFPFTNWVQETPPLPANPPPLMVFEWPKKLILTLDDFVPNFPLAVSQIPIYIPEVGYEIYIPFRRFTIATPQRFFALTIKWRIFEISRKTVQTFDVKDPAENWPLTFNMGPDLFAGETLVGPISVTVTLVQGADPNPSGILNGAPGFDQTLTQVVQPVTGGIAGCAYELIVSCPTSNPQKLLTLVGVLPVQR